MTVEHLSYSQLNSFTGCGEQFRLERIEKVKARPAWWFIGGRAVHEMSEHHDLRGLGVDVPSLTFEDVFERETAAAEEESGVDRAEFRAGGRVSKAWPDKENAAWWLAEGPAMVNRWITWRRACPWEVWVSPDGEFGIELEVNVPIAGAVVHGYLDRAFADGNGNVIVLDLKTGASTPSVARQLGTYKRGLEEAYPGLNVAYGTFWDARKGATGKVYDLSRYTADRLEWQYGALKFARESGIYLPNPLRCSSCGVADWCYEVDGSKVDEVNLPWQEKAA